MIARFFQIFSKRFVSRGARRPKADSDTRCVSLRGGGESENPSPTKYYILCVFFWNPV